MKTIVSNQQTPLRIDRFLTERLPELSRTLIQKLIRDGHIRVNDQAIRVSYQVEPDDVIAVNIPEPTPAIIPAEDIDLSIVYEDGDLMVVNKPAGMVVHPAAGHRAGTLVNALLYHRGDQLSGIGGEMKPGIVHRLDKETSGLLMIAKNDRAHRHLSAQLKDRSLTREYHAIVWGQPFEKEGTIETALGRHYTDRKKMMVNPRGRQRTAITHYKVLKYFELCTYVQVQLATGRTHQIRVHFQHIHHPVVGDPTYGGRESYLSGIRAELRSGGNKLLKLMPRQALHAKRIAFIHPTTKDIMSFDSDLSEDFARLLDFLQEQ